MTTPTIFVDNDMLLGSIRRLYNGGDITIDQYANSLRRFSRMERTQEVIIDIKTPQVLKSSSDPLGFSKFLSECGVDYVK